jgi:hypothetical protein
MAKAVLFDHLGAVYQTEEAVSFCDLHGLVA